MPTLRDYQVDIVNELSRAWRQGYKSPCIVLPCGGGKSCIVAEVAKRTTGNGGQVLFLVHRQELCDQIERTFKWWGVNMDLCQIGMVQTITRHLQATRPPKLIITDENHHARAAGYERIYKAFPKAYKIGLTATPVRLDGKGLRGVNDILVIGPEVHELIEMGALSKFVYYAPKTIDVTGLKKIAGDFDTEQVERRFTSEAYGNTIAYYKKLADGKKAICYLPSVKISKTCAFRLQMEGIPAEHIDGGTPKAERERIINDFRKGKIRILCNVDLISEGFDVPDCECVLLLRPTASLTLHIQQSMRCMRYRPGKTAIILDFVDNVSKHGTPNDIREWSLDGGVKQEITHMNTTCPYCLAVFQRKPGMKFCPICKTLLPERTPQPKIEEVAELEEIDTTPKIRPFKALLKTPDDCRSYGELSQMGKDRNYKPGWAYYQAKKRGLL